MQINQAVILVLAGVEYSGTVTQVHSDDLVDVKLEDGREETSVSSNAEHYPNLYWKPVDQQAERGRGGEQSQKGDEAEQERGVSSNAEHYPNLYWKPVDQQAERGRGGEQSQKGDEAEQERGKNVVDDAQTQSLREAEVGGGVKQGLEAALQSGTEEDVDAAKRRALRQIQDEGKEARGARTGDEVRASQERTDEDLLNRDRDRSEEQTDEERAGKAGVPRNDDTTGPRTLSGKPSQTLVGGVDRADVHKNAVRSSPTERRAEAERISGQTTGKDRR